VVPSRRGDYAPAFALVVALFVCRLALAATIIPPWQNPDEPAHLERVREIGWQVSGRPVPVNANRDVVESMLRFDWWRHYGWPVPDPLPRAAADVTTAVVGGPAAYYFVTGWGLAQLGITGALPQLYVLRSVSAVCGILTLWCAWRGSRHLLPTRDALLVPAVLGLHPQFAIVSTTVSPDGVINLLGALVWWQGLRLIAAPTAVGTLVACWSAGALAPFIRRSGLSVLAMAAVVWICSMSSAFAQGWRHASLHLRAAAATAVLVGGTILMVRAEVTRVLDWTLPMFDRGFQGQQGWEFFTTFSTMLFDNSWLMVGWARYFAPPLWVLAARLIALAALIGLLIAWWRRHLPVRQPLGVVMTVGLAVLQLVAVYAWFLRLHIGPQGRFLFPAAVPFAVLFCIGWLALWPERRRAIGAVILITLVALLDFIAWTSVVIPAYGS
jgi:hypothetical protein